MTSCCSRGPLRRPGAQRPRPAAPRGLSATGGDHRSRYGLTQAPATGAREITAGTVRMAEEAWHEARLIPTSGIAGADDQQERRATSALLAVVGSVREFGRALLKPLGAPAGETHCFIEVPFVLGEQRLYPDGLIRTSRGSKSWTALVEVKPAPTNSFRSSWRTISTSLATTHSTPWSPSPTRSRPQRANIPPRSTGASYGRSIFTTSPGHRSCRKR